MANLSSLLVLFWATLSDPGRLSKSHKPISQLLTIENENDLCFKCRVASPDRRSEKSEALRPLRVLH